MIKESSPNPLRCLRWHDWLLLGAFAIGLAWYVGIFLPMQDREHERLYGVPPPKVEKGGESL